MHAACNSLLVWCAKKGYRVLIPLMQQAITLLEGVVTVILSPSSYLFLSFLSFVLYPAPLLRHHPTVVVTFGIHILICSCDDYLGTSQHRPSTRTSQAQYASALYVRNSSFDRTWTQLQFDAVPCGWNLFPQNYHYGEHRYLKRVVTNASDEESRDKEARSEENSGKDTIKRERGHHWKWREAMSQLNQPSSFKNDDVELCLLRVHGDVCLLLKTIYQTI